MQSIHFHAIPNLAYAAGVGGGALNGETGVYPRPKLSWKSPSGAGTNYVWFGTSEATMSLIWSGSVSGSKSLNLASLVGDLDLGTTYYWKIVNSISGGDGDGAIWSFTTYDTNNGATVPENGPKLILTYDPNQAYWPSPVEDAVNTAPQPTLRWKLNAQNSDLYLATSESALDAMVTPTATVSNDPNGAWPVPSMLTFGQEYWWRIDGDNNSVGEKWKFNVMMMNTAPAITLTPNPLDVYLKFNNPLRSVGSNGDKAAVEARGNKVHLVASAVDADEYPNPILTYTWTQISGPGTASFNPDNDPNTFITLSEPGTYEILFQAYDGEDEANDILVINAPWEPLPELPIDVLHDTFVRGGNNHKNKNYGGEVFVETKNGSGGGNQRIYAKFDLNSVPGYIEGARLSLKSAENMNDGDTVVYAATYGAGGEWAEGTGTGAANPYLGVGVTYDSDTRPVRGAEIGRFEAAPGAWPDGERREIDASAMTVESDGKVTLEVSQLSGNRKSYHSREAGAGEGPVLYVIYDPNIAYAYGIADGATGIHPRPTLSWKTGPNSASSTIYFGTSENDLTLGSWTVNGNGNMSLNLFTALGYELSVGETYYWKIVSSVPGGDGDGHVFSFTVMAEHPDTPILQAPDGGTLVLPIDLSWSASENATGYDLSIGTNPTTVADFTAAVIAVGNVLTVQTADLDLEATYYWTIRGTHPSQGPWPAAEVFSFTTENYEVLDDFEAGVGSWTAGGGGAVSLGTIVDNGSGSMQLDFNDTSAVSTATLALASRDLTSGGRAALRLGYHGIETNADEQTLYVSVTGSSGTVANSYELLEDIQEYSWKGWDNINIDLGDFTGAGLSAVTQLTIGIGEGSGGETGTLFIDDVRLYVQRCVPSTVPGYFLGGDCYADEPNELLALSERWLATEITVDAAATGPLDDTLLLHFTFDEDANDVYYSNTASIGETLANVGDGAPKWGQDPAPIPGGSISSIHISSDDSIRIVDPDLSSADTSATLSMWVKGDLLTDQVKASGKLPQRELLRVSTTDNDQYWKVFWPSGGGNLRAQGAGGTYNGAVPDDFELIWHHMAMVRDGDNGTSAFYLDGVRVAQDGFWLSSNDVVNPFRGPDVTGIPIPRQGKFDGYIDEFRFYGSALSQAQIIWLANLPQVTQPVLGMGPDTNNDDNFDYEDLGNLAEVWYKEILFPPAP